jgi:hypothetical protein
MIINHFRSRWWKLVKRLARLRSKLKSSRTNWQTTVLTSLKTWPKTAPIQFQTPQKPKFLKSTLIAVLIRAKHQCWTKSKQFTRIMTMMHSKKYNFLRLKYAYLKS